MGIGLVVVGVVAGVCAQDLEELVDMRVESSEGVLAGEESAPPFFAQWGHILPTVRVLPRGMLDFRVAHHFAKLTGGVQTMFGFAFVTDAHIGFYYGLTDRLTLGVGYYKGSWVARRLLEGRVKYQVMVQRGGVPVHLTVVANSVYVVGNQSPYAPAELTSLERYSGMVMVLVGRRMGKLTVQVSPYVVYHPLGPLAHNGVYWGGGLTVRYLVVPIAALVVEGAYTVNPAEPGWYVAPVAVGLSILTGGHVFSVRLVNSRGLLENQFLPFTIARPWLGGVRFGFTITRYFGLGV